MSDSDDTELLLLIPPDFYFLREAESETSVRSLPIEATTNNCFCLDSAKKSFNGYLEDNQSMASSYHYHLPPRQQHEIDQINAKISQVERSFTAIDCDMSTVSNRTVKSNFVPIAPIKSSANTNESFTKNAITSTPKHLYLHSGYRERLEDDNGILREIDKYLGDKSYATTANNLHYNHQMTNGSNHYGNKTNGTTPAANEVQNSHKEVKNCENPLISLTDLWENKNIEYSSGSSSFTQLQEERLRRQHCEKTIQALQAKLLEFQQKISVALQVDKAKDNAICNLQDENNKLKQDIKKSEEQIAIAETKTYDELTKLKTELAEMKASKDCLEKELSQALNLAAKFQDKNEILEIKVENFSKTTDEVQALYKKQIEDMEIRVLNAQKAEEIANSELAKIQDLLAKTQNDEEKASKQSTLYRKQFDALQLKTKNFDKLEAENKSLSDEVTKLSKQEKELLKEIECQKITLKTHYQHQLEKVVEQKLIEFQSQLDSVEETLKSEARQRERTLAERAIKQLELINQKNEQEIILINEKHSEEIELYRIQLGNACKRIEELEEMLSSFRSRRVDMAEQLHSVMETQWQKALEILTSPNAKVDLKKPINQLNIEKNKFDGLSADSGITKPENESFGTPTSSRNRTHNRRHDERLQAYIELLLSKSPRDLDNLETILNIPKSNPSSNDRSKNTTNSEFNKPPWK